MKETGNILIIKLPSGICQGAIETYPERWLEKWKLGCVGEGKSKKGRTELTFGKKQRRRK